MPFRTSRVSWSLRPIMQAGQGKRWCWHEGRSQGLPVRAAMHPTSLPPSPDNHAPFLQPQLARIQTSIPPARTPMRTPSQMRVLEMLAVAFPRATGKPTRAATVWQTRGWRRRAMATQAGEAPEGVRASEAKAGYGGDEATQAKPREQE